MIKKMNSIKFKLVIILALTLGIFMGFMPFVSTAISHAQAVNAEYFRLTSHHCKNSLRAAQLNFAATSEALSVSSGGVGLTHDDGPYSEHNVYTGDGEQVFLAGGIVVTADGRPVRIADTSRNSRSGSLVLVWDYLYEGAYNGNDQILQAMFNSQRDRMELGMGSLASRAITLTDELYMVNYSHPVQGIIPLWVYMRNQREGGVIFGSIVRRVYDMNGHALDYTRIEGLTQPRPLWQSLLIPFVAIIEVIRVGQHIHWRRGLETMTRYNLIKVARATRFHPLPAILDIAVTGMLIMTSEGDEIRVNPRTYQLLDRAGSPILCADTWLPLVFYNSNVVTSANVIRPVNNAMLFNTISASQLLFMEIDHFIGYFSTPRFGYLNFAMVNIGPFDAPIWRLPNGDDVPATMVPQHDSRIYGARSGFFRRLFGGGPGNEPSCVQNIGAALATVFIVFVIIVGVVFLVRLIVYLFKKKNKNQS